MDRSKNLNRSFVAAVLIAQLAGFNGEPMGGTRRAIEILSGQKSSALIPPLQGVAAASGDSPTAID